MFRSIAMVALITVVSACTTHVAHAQFGGIRVQVGGYNNGIRGGGYGYGYYNNRNMYQSGYGNRYYGNPYNNVYSGGYYRNSQPYTGYYPNFGRSYVAPYYVAPRPYAVRRFRYR
jgi:hypothetical protein